MKTLAVRMFIKALVAIATLAFAHQALGQNYQLPLERRITESIENWASTTDLTLHTAMKPFHFAMVPIDSVPRINNRDKRYFSQTEARLFGTHMFEVHEKGFDLMFDVILDLDLGFEYGDSANWENATWIYNNTRGAALYGAIGDRVSFHATVFENQSRYPYYLFAYTDSLEVVPGQGRFKEPSLGQRDYNSATGVISVTATDWLSLHAGHGRHFIGHGYRSMLLSDVAFNYPYLRLQATSNNSKWQYTSTIAELNSLERLPVGEVPEALFQRKGFAFRYLSWMPHPRFELGLFESTTYQRWDTSGTQAYPAAFFAPVPLLSTALFGFNGVQNSAVGLNAKVKLTDDIHVYGQFMLDDPSGGSNGYQAGIFLGKTGIPNLSIRLEHNAGTRGLMAHELPLQSLTHMNQSLAHPLGMNFSETVAIVQHNYKRFWSEWRGFYQQRTSGNAGNINAPIDLVNASTDAQLDVMISDLRLGYTVNPTSNMHAMLGWMWRDQFDGSNHLITSYYYVAFRVLLFNRYYDL
ncbi:MAG: hypothetical protein ACFCUH_12150 [Flavobacteriales bacterium]